MDAGVLPPRYPMMAAEVQLHPAAPTGGEQMPGHPREGYPLHAEPPLPARAPGLPAVIPEAQVHLPGATVLPPVEEVQAPKDMTMANPGAPIHLVTTGTGPPRNLNTTGALVPALTGEARVQAVPGRGHIVHHPGAVPAIAGQKAEAATRAPEIIVHQGVHHQVHLQPIAGLAALPRVLALLIQGQAVRVVPVQGQAQAIQGQVDPVQAPVTRDQAGRVQAAGDPAIQEVPPAARALQVAGRAQAVLQVAADDKKT